MNLKNAVGVDHGREQRGSGVRSRRLSRPEEHALQSRDAMTAGLRENSARTGSASHLRGRGGGRADVEADVSRGLAENSAISTFL